MRYKITIEAEGETAIRTEVESYALFATDSDENLIYGARDMKAKTLSEFMTRIDGARDAALIAAIHYILQSVSDPDEDVQEMQKAYDEFDHEVREEGLLQ